MEEVFRSPKPLLVIPLIQRLLAFGEDVFQAGERACISRVLDGSLVVQAYTNDPEIKVESGAIEE